MYKRIFYFLLIAVAFPFSLKAEEVPAKLFADANQQYSKGRFAEAVKTYHVLIDSGYNAPELYFNLGNAYYKLDDLPSAILYYEKAYKLAPGDEDLKVNLQLANLKITDKIEPVPEFFLMKWWRELVMVVSVKVWAIVAVLSLFFASLLLIMYLFSQVLKIIKVSFYLGIIITVVGLFCTSLAATQSSYFENANHAIVFEGSVEVKSGPQKSMKTLFVIPGGLKVRIAGEENGWLRVVLPNGNIGWIESGTVKEI